MHFDITLEEKEIFKRINSFRSFLAITVLFSHIWAYSKLGFLLPFNKGVTIAVSLFFSLSGYGLARSFLRKDRYIYSIYIIKIPYLFYMALMAYIVSAIMQIFLRIDDPNVYLPVNFFRFIKTTNWYVFELVAFYIVFSITACIINKYLKLFIIFILSVIGFVLLYYSGLVEAYYNSIFGFTAGVFLGFFNYTVILKYTKIGFLIGSLILFISFLLMFIINKSSLLFALIRNIAAGGALIFLIYICSIFKIDNTFNKFLCNISPELYFYHIPVALLLDRIIINPYIYMFFVIAISFLWAIVFRVLNKKVHNWWLNVLT